MTEIIITIAAVIYFGINIFFAGMYYEDEGFAFTTKREKIILIFIVSLLIFLYLLIAITLFLKDFLEKLFTKLELRFWWSFFFTKKFRNMTLKEKEDLEKHRRKPTSLRNRYRNWCIDVCLKRKSNQ